MEKEICFLPVVVKKDCKKEVKTTVWLELYEEKYRYAGEYAGWMRECEYRLRNE